MKFMFLLGLSFFILLINGKTLNKNFHNGHMNIAKICDGYNCDKNNLHETETNIDYQSIGNKNINKIRIKRAREDKNSIALL